MDPVADLVAEPVPAQEKVEETERRSGEVAVKAEYLRRKAGPTGSTAAPTTTTEATATAVAAVEATATAVGKAPGKRAADDGATAGDVAADDADAEAEAEAEGDAGVDEAMEEAGHNNDDGGAQVSGGHSSDPVIVAARSRRHGRKAHGGALCTRAQQDRKRARGQNKNRKHFQARETNSVRGAPRQARVAPLGLTRRGGGWTVQLCHATARGESCKYGEKYVGETHMQWSSGRTAGDSHRAPDYRGWDGPCQLPTQPRHQPLPGLQARGPWRPVRPL